MGPDTTNEQNSTEAKAVEVTPESASTTVESASDLTPGAPIRQEVAAKAVGATTPATEATINAAGGEIERPADDEFADVPEDPDPVSQDVPGTEENTVVEVAPDNTVTEVKTEVPEAAPTAVVSNEDTMIISRQADGNWKGYWRKHDNDIEVRAGDPNTVLQLLITHE